MYFTIIDDIKCAFSYVISNSTSSGCGCLGLQVLPVRLIGFPKSAMVLTEWFTCLFLVQVGGCNCVHAPYIDSPKTLNIALYESYVTMPEELEPHH
jgi:hypothetical protein